MNRLETKIFTMTIMDSLSTAPSQPSRISHPTCLRKSNAKKVISICPRGMENVVYLTEFLFFYYFIPLGGVVVHFILCIYTMLMIGVVIDEYFVPSLEIIAEGKYINPMLNQFIF